jgi:hypothetical protein
MYIVDVAIEEATICVATAICYLLLKCKVGNKTIWKVNLPVDIGRWSSGITIQMAASPKV